MSRVRILTDSTSDIPPDVAERLHITIVPAYVQIAGRSYRDANSPGALSREEFYARLPGMPSPPTTAVPPAHEFSRAYRRLAGEADDVIAIVLAANLSGMYNVARLGAQDVEGVRVHVVDSGQLSMGLGWMVVAAAEAAAAGRSASDILALVDEMKSRVYVYAVLDTLEYLRRSGRVSWVRVSWVRARAAQILRIKPVLQVLLGKVTDLGQTRTRRRAIERLVDLARSHQPLERLAILHSCAPDVDELRGRLLDLCPSEQVLTVAITTIVGTHVGPRGLGVAVVAAG